MKMWIHWWTFQGWFSKAIQIMTFSKTYSVGHCKDYSFEFFFFIQLISRELVRLPVLISTCTHRPTAANIHIIQWLIVIRF